MLRLPSHLSLCLATLLLALMGCASTPGGNPLDPFEATNRKIDAFNDSVDQAVLKPVAKSYKDYTPEFLQTTVKNFFGNLRDMWSVVNNGLQLKPKETVETGMRVAMNSVIGLYGLLDVGTPMGLQRHTADFGQTLGYWGMPSGPYVVLPLLGPSTVRDTAALVVDQRGDPWAHINPVASRNEGIALRLVDKRAQFLGMDDRLSEAALDKYSFVRDAFLQKRRAEVRRGPPSDVDELEEKNSDLEPRSISND
jgi:phospholipid-binding lipoprotein MlaA